MQAISTNDRVRLTEKLPELDLYAGQVGVIRGAWFYPNIAYEVEFEAEQQHQLRLLLLQHQIARA